MIDNKAAKISNEEVFAHFHESRSNFSSKIARDLKVGHPPWRKSAAETGQATPCFNPVTGYTFGLYNQLRLTVLANPYFPESRFLTEAQSIFSGHIIDYALLNKLEGQSSSSAAGRFSGLPSEIPVSLEDVRVFGFVDSVSKDSSHTKSLLEQGVDPDSFKAKENQAQGNLGSVIDPKYSHSILRTFYVYPLSGINPSESNKLKVPEYLPIQESFRLAKNWAENLSISLVESKKISRDKGAFCQLDSADPRILVPEGSLNSPDSSFVESLYQSILMQISLDFDPNGAERKDNICREIFDKKTIFNQVFIEEKFRSELAFFLLNQRGFVLDPSNVASSNQAYFPLWAKKISEDSSFLPNLCSMVQSSFEKQFPKKKNLQSCPDLLSERFFDTFQRMDDCFANDFGFATFRPIITDSERDRALARDNGAISISHFFVNKSQAQQFEDFHFLPYKVRLNSDTLRLEIATHNHLKQMGTEALPKLKDFYYKILESSLKMVELDSKHMINPSDYNARSADAPQFVDFR